MKLRQIIQGITLALVIGPVFASSPAVKAPVKPLTPAQKAQFEQVIREYLLKEPEVLIEAGQVLQTRQRDAMNQRAQSAIKENAKALFNNNSPIVGNAKGDVNVVEFFDYQCSHCKDMSEVMSNLVKADSNVRVIYKEFPIFGAGSEFAAKAALAANKQGKYEALHKALLAAKSRLNKDKVLAMAKQVGLNTQQLQKDMNSPAIKAQLKENYKLASALGIMGTPAFIVAGNPADKNDKRFFIPGATSLEKLQSKISEVRQ